MGRYSSGQRGQTVNLLRKLRRFESFSAHFFSSIAESRQFAVDFIANCQFQLKAKDKCGSSSVGRATAFQAVGRGFEPRLPLSELAKMQLAIYSPWL